ncbi:MAG: T9SS type A sorting domain-containing protein [Saprospiraceae bacterium]|nr:T9SS type A sorting domain-containing protein [Saprospiraceae bacterium]
MKKILLFIAIVFLSSTIYAQTTVYFNLNHFLGNKPFTKDNVGNNDINTPFKITRLEYYISEISLIHDGGIVTPVKEFWILTDIFKRGSYELGKFDIQHLESVVFHIGVDPDHNNGDPAVYPEGHPLALKVPAMHWGWAAGYNFIALEGLGGNQLDKAFQIHTLGNENYKEVKIDLDIYAENGQLNIPIRGDYDMAMRTLDASVGIFYHGPAKFGIKLADNFASYVFSRDEAVSTTHQIEKKTSFQLLPNIAQAGSATVKIKSFDEGNFDIHISDSSGKLIRSEKNAQNGTVLQLNGLEAGIYFISINRKGLSSITQKLVIY